VSGRVPALSLVSGEGRWPAGCSGSQPGHTLSPAARGEPWSERDGEFRGGWGAQSPSPPPPQGTSTGPGGPVVHPLNHLTHLVPPTLAPGSGCGLPNLPGYDYADTEVNTGTQTYFCVCHWLCSAISQLEALNYG